MQERGWKRREGRFMVAVMQKCKHFATFAENNDTTGKGRCVCVFVMCMSVMHVFVCVCVRVLLCGWVQQQHRREQREEEEVK